MSINHCWYALLPLVAPPPGIVPLPVPLVVPLAYTLLGSVPYLLATLPLLGP